MLQTVRIVNDRNDALVLTLSEVVEGIFVKDIDGLDPVKATIVTSGLAGQDGLHYQESRREGRNIVIKLGVESGPLAGTVQQIRSKLMGFFMPKSQVTFQFSGDGIPSVSIAGRVEDFDFPIFSRDPEGTVSILCFDPDFQEMIIRGTPGVTNPGNQDNFVPYEGTVETGFTFTFHPSRDIEGFEIYHRPGDGTLRLLKFNAPLKNGDKLEIVTERNKKRATLTRNGISSSVLYGVDPTSEWLNLFPGTNNFVVVLDDVAMPYGISYRNKFGSL